MCQHSKSFIKKETPFQLLLFNSWNEVVGSRENACKSGGHEFHQPPEFDVDELWGLFAHWYAIIGDNEVCRLRRYFGRHQNALALRG